MFSMDEMKISMACSTKLKEKKQHLFSESANLFKVENLRLIQESKNVTLVTQKPTLSA